MSTMDANDGTPGSLGNPDKGIYEPHFIVLEDGGLAPRIYIYVVILERCF